MINEWELFIKSITDEEFITIFDEYIVFEKNGCIGECLMRTKACEWIASCNMSGYMSMSEPILMRDIVFEGFRRFTYYHLKGEQND